MWAIVDCNGCASANRNPDYICVGEGTYIVNSTRRTCNCVFMNVKKPSLPTQVGSPNFQTFDFHMILLAKANAQMFNSTEAIGLRNGTDCKSEPRFATSHWLRVHARSDHLPPQGCCISAII